MPNINLRLTDEEHEALRTWAFEGRRSIQREIIFRLFANGLTERGKAIESEEISELPSSSGSLNSPPRSVSPASHFKPDFK